jgi:hypothetical protein
LCDIDGTLVDVTSIRHHVEGDKRDFDAFHRASIDCPPNLPVVKRLKMLQRKGLFIIAISGREDRFRRLTDFWLAMWDVPCDELRMRKSGDWRSDLIFKKELFGQISARFSVIEVIDDNSELLKMWADLNVPSVVDVQNLVNPES